MKNKKKRFFSSDQVATRYSVLIVAFIVLSVVIFSRAASLMFGAPHDYWMEVSKQFKNSRVEVPAKRGNIVSADGQVLATTLPEYRMFIDFMSWETDSARRSEDQIRRDRALYLKIDSLSQCMHKVFPDVDPASFKRHMLDGRARCHHHWPIYPKRVTYVQYREVASMPYFRLPKSKGGGFHVEEFLKRKHPFGSLAHATVGIYDEERDNLMSGLEQAYDSVLRGTPGVAHYEKVLNQKVLYTDSVAQDGYDIVTTLDVGMQDLVEKTLGDQLKSLGADVGMCILMDVKTGDVKAISSLTRLGEGTYREVDNRAISSRREPGSVFKPMAFMVGFDDGKFDLNDGFDVGCGVREMYGRKMRDSDWRKGGRGRRISAVECIKYSSNVGVSALVDRAYHANPEQFVAGLDRIGIRTHLHLPLHEYRPPKIRYPEKDKYGHWQNWSNTALPWMSIGYETQIPPIQTLTFYNGVANGGKMVKPRFISAIRCGNEVVQEFPVEYIHPDRPGNMMCSASALKKVQTCLEAVVQKHDCTGKDVFTKQFRIAGKTGTAQIWERGGNSGRYIVSFAGYFPADAPQYSMIVCIEKGFPAYGGSMCGPVFKKIAETIWARNFRDDPRSVRDTTAQANDLPFMQSGNVNALSSVLDELNIGYQRNYSGHDGLTWGYNASNVASSATLVADKQRVAGRKNEVVMPDVRGYGLRDAIYRLERLGLRVRSHGAGHVVSQNVPPEHAVKRGQTIELYLSTDDKDKAPEPTPEAPDPAAATPASTSGTSTEQQAAAPAATPSATKQKPG